MAEVGAYEAKTHLPALLKRVERGETITITRHGVPVAVLAPPPDRRREDVRKAVEDLREFSAKLAARGVKVSKEEILRWRHEGHRY